MKLKSMLRLSENSYLINDDIKITIIGDDIQAEFDEKKASEDEVNLLIDELLQNVIDSYSKKMEASGFKEI